MSNTILDNDLGSYSYGDGSQADIRPNRERARIAIMFLYITIGLQFLSMFLLPSLEGMNDPYNYSQEDLLLTGVITMIYGFVLVAINVLTIVFFIRWFRRAYYNLHLIDNRYLYHTEGWASGAWFVPVIWWFRPYQIMVEICKETETHAERLTGQQQVSALPLVGWWWATWIIPMALGIFSSLSSDTEIIFLLDNLEYISGIICGFIVIKIMKTVSIMEGIIYENRGRAGLQHASLYRPY